MQREDPRIVSDIADKCGDDVSGAIMRNIALVDGGHAMTKVAFVGGATAMARAEELGITEWAV